MGGENVATVSGGGTPVSAPAPAAPVTQAEKVKAVFQDHEAGQAPAAPVKDGAETESRVEAQDGGEAKGGGEISPDLRQRARDAGLSPEDLADLPPKAAERIVRLAETKILGMGRTPARQEEEAEERPSKKEAGKTRIKKYELQGLEKYDEELAKQLNGLNEHYAAEVERELSSVHQAIEQREMQRFHGEVVRDVDSALDAVSKEFGEVFGDTEGELSQSHVAARGRVFDETLAMAVGYERAGRKVPPVRVLAKRAAKALFGDSAKDAARKDIEGNIKERERQAIERPTHRLPGRGTETPRQRAEAALDKAIAEKRAKNR